MSVTGGKPRVALVDDYPQRNRGISCKSAPFCRSAAFALREGLGPKVTINAEGGEGFAFVDNPDSILDVTDLVFVDPAGVEVVRIGSAAQLKDAVSKHAPDAHVLVMAAAVADFRPTEVQTSKIKKSGDPADAAPTIELTRTDDVLAGAVRARTDGQLPNMRAIVGFAAETGDANGDVLFHARAKLQRKGCDLLVVNAVGENRAFEVDNNDGWLLAADGTESALEHGSKTLMASRIVDAIVAFLQSGSG